jgi:hypothetical protein
MGLTKHLAIFCIYSATPTPSRNMVSVHVDEIVPVPYSLSKRAAASALRQRRDRK